MTAQRRGHLLRAAVVGALVSGAVLLPAAPALAEVNANPGNLTLKPGEEKQISITVEGVDALNPQAQISVSGLGNEVSLRGPGGCSGNGSQSLNCNDRAFEGGDDRRTLTISVAAKNPSGLQPNQTREGWAKTLRSALALQTQHISCYGLKVEEGTPLYEYRDCVNLPDDDTQADMYLYAVSTLAAYGYQQYEISNFALEGYASRHNLKYWLGGEYLSFGPSAASDFAGKRYTYRADLQTYLKGLRGGENMLSECESIPLRERGGEYLMLRLRTAWGIEETEYQSTYLMPFAPLEEKLREYAGQKLAFRTADGRWRLTPQGFLLSNQIIGELLEIQNNSHPIIRT